MTGNLVPLNRKDNGDGAVTWTPVLDPRPRKNHLFVHTDVPLWPGASIPEHLMCPRRCAPPVLKEHAE